ncbi:hypothetical protein ACFLS9_06195 [Bacteroidota bacterium]
MKNTLLFSLVIFLLAIFSTVNAQFIVKQDHYTIPAYGDLIPDGKDFADLTDEAKFFLNIPESKYRELAKEYGDEIIVERSTIYIDEGKIAVEMESEEEGKFTAISDSEAGKVYMVIWDQKRVIEVSKSEIDQMQEEVKGVDKMMEQLSPEIQEQIKKAKGQGEEGERKVYSTGKKKEISGFDCEQFMVENAPNTMVIWATDDIPELVESAEDISENLKVMFQDEGKKDVDEWELVKGKVPMEVRSFESNMFVDPKISFTVTTLIEEITPPAGKFIPPGEAEGFKKGTMGDFMQDMMKDMEK